MSALTVVGPIQPCGAAMALLDCGTALSDTDSFGANVNLRILITGVCPGVFAFPDDQSVLDQLWLEAGDLITVSTYAIADPGESLAGVLQNIIPGAQAMVASVAYYIYAATNATGTVGQLKSEIQNAFSAVNAAKSVPCSWSIGEVAQIQQAGQTVSEAVSQVAASVAAALPSTSSVGVLLIGLGVVAIGLLIWVNKLEATA